MQANLNKSCSPLDFPQHVEVVLSTFARRHNGVFIVNPNLAARSHRKMLDIYCAFSEETLSQAISAAQNAFAGMHVEARCYSCSDFDSEFLTRVSRGARVFGERRYASR
jgi:hypothetical protein